MYGPNQFRLGGGWEGTMLNTNERQALLTVDEAAEMLRVNRKTLYEAIRLNEVPEVVRIGKTIRIGRSALCAWMGARRPESRA